MNQKDHKENDEEVKNIADIWSEQEIRRSKVNEIQVCNSFKRMGI